MRFRKMAYNIIIDLIKNIYITFICPNSKVYTLFTNTKL